MRSNPPTSIRIWFCPTCGVIKHTLTPPKKHRWAGQPQNPWCWATMEKEIYLHSGAEPLPPGSSLHPDATESAENSPVINEIPHPGDAG